MVALTRIVTDTVGVTDVRAGQSTYSRAFTDAVGITDSAVRFIGQTFGFTEAVEVTNLIDSSSVLVQYDTWRAIPSPDNTLLLACRTPLGEHDTATGLTHNTLWTFKNDGSNENVVLQLPAEYGWDSYGHPEWSPDGATVVIYSEDSTTFNIVKLDASSYDRGASND